jgi:hypothetical protein
MRVFTKVSPQVWSSSTFRSLSGDERQLFLYFLTCEHQNSSGCFRIPDLYALSDLDWQLGVYLRSRDALVEAEMIQFDPETKEVMVSKWFRHNLPMNNSHRKSVLGSINRIASTSLKKIAYERLEAAENEVKGAPDPYAPHVLGASPALLDRLRAKGSAR